MPGKVFVTGIGAVCAIGLNTDEIYRCLITGKSGIGKINILKTHHASRLPAGEVKAANSELIRKAGLRPKKTYSRTTLLGILAAREARERANFSKHNIKNTGLISATSVGGMDRSEEFFRHFQADQSKGRLHDIIVHDCGDSTEAIADYIGINHFQTTISTACSSSANSIMLAARMIKNGILDRAIAGGTDALTLFTLNGFNTLMIYDDSPCKPFDENRKGLNLGEGAGYLVLESEASASKHSEDILCELSGYANANDAFHQTASSPDGAGAFTAMKNALHVSLLKPEDISYINAHGTGTQNNDLAEGTALKTLFENNIPHFSSTKAFTGHTLGAAGGIEAVFSVLSIIRQAVFPNLNFSSSMPELNIKPVVQPVVTGKIKHVMSNSFGFGGNCSSLIFSAC
jgi:3-oxoacyl-(acyl-carrier-protein) synthase